MGILDTGVKNVKNVDRYTVGKGSVSLVRGLLESRRKTSESSYVVFFVDEFFEAEPALLGDCGQMSGDQLFWVRTDPELTTGYVDEMVAKLVADEKNHPCAVVGIGGGTTMDMAKAVSNILGNGGKAEDYQGWDLLQQPGVFKIGVPTLSGTGAEATRTCVMVNEKTGLKLGMNSDFTVFDQAVLDPNLTRSVPLQQYFYTGMDAYIHCLESLNGQYRNTVGDAYSRITMELCREVFASDNMMSDAAREKMMVASYMGGCAVASSYVGLVHPFSAGLSVVLGIHHCEANCIAMRAMEEFYPVEYEEFWGMADKQGVSVPCGIARNLSDDQYEALFRSTLIHEKPLYNALGDKFKIILNKDKVISMFKAM